MTLYNYTTEASDTIMKVTARSQYNSPTILTPTSVDPDPLAQFRTWFKEAHDDPNVPEPEAMALSTVSAKGVPSSRIVLLKTVDARGFVLYTNYTSRKSRELSETGMASLAFYWREQHRQVRVVGHVEKVAKEESEEYYNSRPVGSRVGAWASRQSTVVGENEVQERYSALEERFAVKEGDNPQVPLPDFWGGWRIIPE